MIKTITIVTMLLILPSLAYASAQEIPDWVRNNADWWAQGQIGDSDFVQGIQFLMEKGIMVIPPTAVSAQTSDGIPSWVKNNAGWWAAGQITDNDFILGIQHLVKTGIIVIESSIQMVDESSKDSNSELSSLQAELKACAEITKAYERLDCEDEVENKITAYKYKSNAQLYQVGPIIFYYPGLDTEGNSFEIASSGQAILNIRMLAENTSSDNVSMMCTGPAICSYDVWNGDKAFKYSGMDFTNGQIVLKPGEAREFNMLFGPNIGYGGTTFEYDSSKDYFFRISEPWGTADIPLELK